MHPALTAALLTIDKTDRKFPPTAYRLNKMWYIFIMDCYSAIKKHP